MPSRRPCGASQEPTGLVPGRTSPRVEPVPVDHGPTTRAGGLRQKESGHVPADRGLGHSQLPSDTGLDPVAAAISTEEPQDLATTQDPLGPSHRVVAGTARGPSAYLVPAGRGPPGLTHFDFPFFFRVSCHPCGPRGQGSLLADSQAGPRGSSGQSLPPGPPDSPPSQRPLARAPGHSEGSGNPESFEPLRRALRGA
jgi:hypothetical protein